MTMQLQIEKPLCAMCTKPIHGRSDKKFCSDGCRNLYHNHVSKIENAHFRRTNAQLARNRRLLASHLPKHCRSTTVDLQTLATTGFRFTQCTRAVLIESYTLYECYDFRYRLKGKGKIVITHASQ